MTDEKDKNLHVERYASLGEREAATKQKGFVVWITGLSGSGKSTIARLLERELLGREVLAYVLDGDNIRKGLCADLSFSAVARNENIRRIGHVAALFAKAGVATATAFISPYREDRDRARAIAPAGRFIEVYLSASVDVCAERDPNGLYAKAKAGMLLNPLTGMSDDAPYHPPLDPEITIPPELSQEQAVAEIIAYLEEKELLLK